MNSILDIPVYLLNRVTDYFRWLFGCDKVELPDYIDALIEEAINPEKARYDKIQNHIDMLNEMREQTDEEDIRFVLLEATIQLQNLIPNEYYRPEDDEFDDFDYDFLQDLRNLE